MAIVIEFINLVLPVERIEAKYPNGWAGFLKDNEKKIGKIVWYDDYLCHAGGCMDAEAVDQLIFKWTQLGFSATEVVNGTTVWKDFCIFSPYGGSDHDCPWLEGNFGLRAVWLKGTDPGEIIGRSSFSMDLVQR